MTENKRFYIEDNGIWDNTWKRRKSLTWRELCDTLNKFQELSIKDLELIEQLKKENEELKIEKELWEKRSHFAVDLQNRLHIEKEELFKENGKLKKEVEELKVDLKMARIDGTINRMAQRPMRW